MRAAERGPSPPRRRNALCSAWRLDHWSFPPLKPLCVTTLTPVTKFGRIVVFATSLLLAVGLSATTAAPASATVTTLCKGYSACAKAGMSASGYAGASKTMYWRMYSGHNCTNYAAYRMIQSGFSKSRPWSGSGNATNWGSAMKGITNGSPAVGAVAWWKAHVSPAGSSGHVAYVERVVSANEIIVSQDSWGGDFSWARVTRASKGWPSGFVHFNDVRQRNTTAPAITGTAKVGSVLNASTGAWTPSGATFRYQWRQNGVNIAGATGRSLTLARAQQDKKIAVQVTATHLGYPTASALSARTTAVQPGVITNTEVPKVTGDSRVDATLSASPGAWTPNPDSVRYQWRADGEPLAGATASTLTMGPAFASKTISVTVTAAKNGYAAVSKTSATTAPVKPGTLKLAARPSLSGKAVLGRTLTLRQPRTPPQSTVAVQWVRDGVRVPGATGRRYRVTSADLGSKVAARFRVTRPGYTTLMTRTTWTQRVRTTPVLRVTTQPGTGRLVLSATVRARGVKAVAGVLKVRSRGKLLTTTRVRNGAAKATLTKLPRGTHGYRFRFLTTNTVTEGVVERRIHIS